MTRALTSWRTAATAVLGLPLLGYGLLAWRNLLEGGRLSTMTGPLRQPGFPLGWLVEWPRVALLDGLFFQKGMDAALFFLAPASKTALGACAGWAVFAATLFALSRVRTLGERAAEWGRWFLLCFLVVSLCLGALSVARYAGEAWTPVLEYRYYWVISPLLLVLWWSAWGKRLTDRTGGSGAKPILLLAVLHRDRRVLGPEWSERITSSRSSNQPSVIAAGRHPERAVHGLTQRNVACTAAGVQWSPAQGGSPFRTV